MLCHVQTLQLLSFERSSANIALKGSKLLSRNMTLGHVVLETLISESEQTVTEINEMNDITA